MTRPQRLAAALLTAASLAHPNQARANADCGPRLFPVTLTLDDPGVGDEAAVPTVTYQRFASTAPTPGDDATITANVNKRLTDDLMVGIGTGYDIDRPQQGKNQTGWQDLQLLAKWQQCVSPEHEFMFSLGVIRELGDTGSVNARADRYGSTAPALYLGKGFGDLSNPALRPLAVTGELYRSFSDHAFAFDHSTIRTNGASPDSWFGAVSAQYSLLYVQQHMKQLDLPPWATGLIPLVELSWVSPASQPTNIQTAWRAAPGVIYEGEGYELALEAQIPLGRSAGTNVGVIAQVYIFIDDLYPNSIGKPVAAWFN